MKKLTKIKLLTMCGALALNATFATEITQKGSEEQPTPAEVRTAPSGWTWGGVLSYFNPLNLLRGASTQDRDIIEAALGGVAGAMEEAVVSHAMLQLSPEEQEAAMAEMRKASIQKKLEDAIVGFAELPENVRTSMLAAVLDPENTPAFVEASKAIIETKGLDGTTVLNQLTSIIRTEKAKDEMPALIPSDSEKVLEEAVGGLSVTSPAPEKLENSALPAAASAPQKEPEDITLARGRWAELEKKKTDTKLTKTEKGQLAALKKKVEQFERKNR